MKTWSEEEFNAVIVSEDFIANYRSYCEDNDHRELTKYLSSIKLNEKYFRLTTNSKIGQNKRFRNKNVSEDTLALKEVNSFLNKLTDKNIKTITEKIKTKLIDKIHLKQLIIVNVLRKCILQPLYNIYYLDILIDIYSEETDINDLILTEITVIGDHIKKEEINTEQTEYLQFCDKNKKLDNLIGHSLLITELEKKNIINDKTIPLLNSLIALISETNEMDEKYKCVQCLYNIFKAFHGLKPLSKDFSDKLSKLIEIEKYNKIKYILMDITERR